MKISLRTLFTYIAGYFITGSTILRSQFGLHRAPFEFPVIFPLIIFVILMVSEPFLSRRSKILIHIYLGVQSTIVIFVLLIPPHADYFATLFIVLTLQAMYVLREKIGFRWVVAFLLIMMGMMLYAYEFGEALAFILVYTIVYLGVAGLVAITRQAEEAREESQRLLSELQTAHVQLKEYARQVEELSAEQERSRLARNLHDSVTQTIFSMTLSAEAAKLLADRDKDQAVEQLDHLLALARSALAEMRSLIFELRPSMVAEIGLIPSLRQHLSHLEDHNNLKIALCVSEEPDLPTRQAQRLFYIIREALNNVVKHAGVREAKIDLCTNDHISVSIEDQGAGFDPEAMDVMKESIGLSSMRERVDMMGGNLTIDSSPGEGTRIRVELPIQKDAMP